MSYRSLVSVAIFALALGAQSVVSQAPAGVSLSAELTKGIDVKKAKAGDGVNARTTNAATLADGTELPKGTKLMGRVTEVRAKSNADKTSHVGFVLEQAVTKDGHEIPLQVMVMSITVPLDTPDLAALTAGAHGGGAATDRNPSTAPTMATNPNTTYAQQSVIKSQTQQAQETDGMAGHAPNQRLAIGNLPGAVLTTADGKSQSASVDLVNDNVWLGQGTKMTLFVAARK